MERRSGERAADWQSSIGCRVRVSRTIEIGGDVAYARVVHGLHRRRVGEPGIGRRDQVLGSELSKTELSRHRNVLLHLAERGRVIKGVEVRMRVSVVDPAQLA